MSQRPSLISTMLLIFSVVLLMLVGAFSFGGYSDSSVDLHAQKIEWQVQQSNGYDPLTPANFDSHTLPAEWQSVDLPFALPIALLGQASTMRTPDATQTTWFRLQLPDISTRDKPLALYAARVRTGGTVAIYANGQLVHRAQQNGTLWNSSRTPLWIEFAKTDDSPPLREILIRLEHSAKSQVALSSIWIGSTESLYSRYHVRLWLQQELPAMLSMAFLAVGIFALLVWTQRKHEIAYLLFFQLAATAFLRGLHFYSSIPIANDWFAWLTVNSLFWLVTSVHFFLRQLHGRPLKWLTRALVATTVLVGILTLPLFTLLPNTPKITPLIYVVAATMGATAGLIGGINAWRVSSEGRLIAVGILICTLLGVDDWLLQNNFISPEGWYLGAYMNAVCFTVFGVLMYRRYVNAINEIEEVNASLALRLQQREAELEMSHQRLREIELRQTISDERQRLMQDMHDGLGSSLISAIRSMESGGMSELQVSQILKDCLDDLKLTIDSMEPVDADLLLLLATLRFRLEPRLEGTGIALHWEVQELPTMSWLDPSSALHILRIVQESIANILRHTRADAIRVATARDVDGVTISIEDNGHGFDIEHALAHANGRGLRNQHRRAQALDGKVSWRSSATGTLFQLWLPLQRGA
ncbi:MAG: sensor histidine kinase [Burkholderiaceae bacterium]|uniref:histidine kinase n=1 Tax=Herminiimonas contaminans TaxID=1111140 RepID=A0ABS0EYX9_9BURK|nr:ATP-binding protein [Herminiimonas contaminans]MBF8178858.1 sensor histidine kinase [Herminiimonas contaminans]MBX9798366.1 sensor histidine kinase [Burkholderiaceae bacterium]